MSKNLDIARSYTDSEINTSLGLKANLSGGNFTGLVATAGNSQTFNSANDTTLSIRSNGTGTPATMSFHRPGAYAINFGLDTDNVLKAGGWSAGSSYPVMLDTAHTFATNGYQRFSNGLIIQWGSTAVNVSSVTNISFPIVFPTALFSVTALHQTDGSQSYLYQVDSPTTSYFRVRWDRPSGGDPQAPVHFIAIGY